MGCVLCINSLQGDDLLKLEKENWIQSNLYLFKGYPFHWQKVSLKQAIANVEKYTIRFDDKSLPQATGYSRGLMETGGGFFGLGSDLITDKSLIGTITQTFEQLPQAYGIYNLIAYAGKLPKKELSEIIFVDEQNRYAIRGGEVFDFEFDLLTFIAADTFIRQDWATFLYRQAQKLSVFLQGDPSAPKTIYAYGTPDDFQFTFTNAFYNEILPFVESGKVKIWWSLTSINPYIQSASRGKVFAIYEGKVPEGAPYPHTPAGAWAYNEDNFDQATLTGAILPIVNPNEKTIQFANAALGFGAAYAIDIPMLFYINTQGVPDYFTGLPPDIQAFVDSIQSD